MLQLHHVQLAIPQGSEEDCRKFYCLILGWTEKPKPAALAARGGHWLTNGNAELHPGVEDDFRTARKAHPAFLITEIEKGAADLAKHDFDVIWDESIPAYKHFFVFDVVGNRLEFMQLAGWSEAGF